MDQPTCLLIPLPGTAKNSFGVASGKRAFGCRRYSTTGCDRLNAAHTPAAAHGPMRISQRMSQMPSQTASPGQQFPTADDSPANACGDGNKHQITVLTTKRMVLSPRRCLCVIDGQGRQVGDLF